MKKLAAIFLILLLAFNWYGYRLVVSILSYHADRQLEARIDKKEYKDEQLLELRIPLNNPYQRETTRFERHYGEMEIGGRHYTYVKRKVENGYLVLKCIPNNDKEKLKIASQEYFKLTNGLDGNQGEKQHNSSTQLAKIFWSEYDDRDLSYQLAELNIDASVQNAELHCNLQDIFHPTWVHPPDSSLL